MVLKHYFWKSIQVVGIKKQVKEGMDLVCSGGFIQCGDKKQWRLTTVLLLWCYHFTTAMHSLHLFFWLLPLTQDWSHRGVFCLHFGWLLRRKMDTSQTASARMNTYVTKILQVKRHDPTTGRHHYCTQLNEPAKGGVLMKTNGVGRSSTWDDEQYAKVLHDKEPSKI